MISKCANPECFTGFRYLHEGKLFQFEVGLFDPGPIDLTTANHNEKRLREIERFGYVTYALQL